MPQKIRCRVTEVQAHGEGVYSLFLQPESPAPRFRPGQFLHLALDSYTPGDFWPDSRTFSIASAPTERQRMRITYAVKGKFTTRMEAELHEGSQVWVKMPYGDFIIPTGQDMCLLAGGTGITAFTAFLAGLAVNTSNQIHLFYGARRPDLLIYRPLVQAAAQRCPGLHACYFAEENFAGSDCRPGRIEVGAVFACVSDPLALTYYLAGPPGMIQALTAGLRQCGLAPEQIIADAWE
jgi:ferredoxin-NADP reductase